MHYLVKSEFLVRSNKLGPQEFKIQTLGTKLTSVYIWLNLGKFENQFEFERK
jgi:hypothetical protein